VLHDPLFLGVHIYTSIEPPARAQSPRCRCKPARLRGITRKWLSPDHCIASVAISQIDLLQIPVALVVFAINNIRILRIFTMKKKITSIHSFKHTDVVGFEYPRDISNFVKRTIFGNIYMRRSQNQFRVIWT
jgi:hypothetical protein